MAKLTISCLIAYTFHMAGRPSAYSDALGDSICDRLIGGESLRTICNDDDMPHRITVIRWLSDAKYEQFATKYARARELQGDAMDERIVSVADDVLAGTVDANAGRVAIMAYQWRASKLAPKRYGEKIHNEVSGAGGGPITLNILPVKTDKSE